MKIPVTSYRLSDVVEEAQPGFACGEEHPDGVFQIRMNNILPDGTLDLDKKRRVPAGIRTINSTLLRPEDVLFNATNSPDLVGKTALINDLAEPTVFSNHFLRLRANRDLLHPAYLARWLSREFSRGTFKGLARQWVNQATVGRDALLNLTIALPAVAEQSRIVEILDQTDELQAKRRRVINLLDDLARSVFLDMFGDPLTNPRRWDTQKISQLGTVVTGNTPSRTDLRNYGHYIEWIKSDNINPSNMVVETALERLSESGARYGRIAPPNSLLVTCIAGSMSSIGNVALTDRYVAFNQQINAFIPAGLDPLFAYMQLRVGKILTQSASTGGMKGLVNKARFAAIELMVPPLELQTRFASKLRTIADLMSSAREQAILLQGLFTSLQERAFRNEL